MFHHFGWKLHIQGQICMVLGVNVGQISIFHFITPKKAHYCAISHLLNHCASKSVQGSLIYVGPRKKNSHTKGYNFTPLPRGPPERIFTRFGTKRSSRGRNQSCQIVCLSVQGFRFYRGSIFPFFP